MKSKLIFENQVFSASGVRYVDFQESYIARLEASHKCVLEQSVEERAFRPAFQVWMKWDLALVAMPEAFMRWVLGVQLNLRRVCRKNA